MTIPLPPTEARPTAARAAHRRRHELPTHLNVEDRVVLGLTLRQLMILMFGCAAAYGLWSQWTLVPAELRVTLAVGCLIAATLLALARPHGRPLEEWGFAALRYATVPKATVWRAVASHSPIARRARRPLLP
ncbi:MAG TPA: PrgI family protein [Chloroflexota bacterium]|nr:PrgI family protein [Chloroflexota bacterium]